MEKEEEDFAVLVYQDTMRRRAEAAAMAEAAAAAGNSLTRPRRTSPRLMDNDGTTKSEVKEAAPKRKRARQSNATDDLNRRNILLKNKSKRGRTKRYAP
mmetsp:Transcript_1197/g.2399  ORF Transcript_1197/g.2399 Transcript_1197/m.2399 type:complete len:99 (+) Transcript_1197:55-351(+)